MQMRANFMDPLLESLISFQIYFFEQGAASLNSLGQYIDLSAPIEEPCHTKRAPAIEFLKTLSLVVPIKIDSEADPSSRTGMYHSFSCLFVCLFVLFVCLLTLRLLQNTRKTRLPSHSRATMMTLVGGFISELCSPSSSSSLLFN